MAPLASNPVIQRALTDKITTEITTHLHVVTYTKQAANALAGRGLGRVAAALRSFAPSIAGAVAGFIHSQVHKVVTSQAFARLWTRLNAVVHTQLVKALSGRGGGAISVQNGQVMLGLGPFINEAKQRLAARGLTIVERLPAINPMFPVARNHRRALIAAGLGVTAATVGLAAGLLIARGIYLSSVPNNKLPADAAAALFDTLVRFIRQGLRTRLVVGLVVAAGAFLTGPSVSAVRTRSAISAGLCWLRERGELHGVRTGPVGHWTYAHRKALRAGVTGAVVLIFGRPPARPARAAPRANG